MKDNILHKINNWLLLISFVLFVSGIILNSYIIALLFIFSLILGIIFQNKEDKFKTNGIQQYVIYGLIIGLTIIVIKLLF